MLSSHARGDGSAKYLKPAAAALGAHTLITQFMEWFWGPRTERLSLRTQLNSGLVRAVVWAAAPVLILSAVR